MSEKSKADRLFFRFRGLSAKEATIRARNISFKDCISDDYTANIGSQDDLVVYLSNSLIVEETKCALLKRLSEEAYPNECDVALSYLTCLMQYLIVISHVNRITKDHIDKVVNEYSTYYYMRFPGNDRMAVAFACSLNCIYKIIDDESVKETIKNRFVILIKNYPSSNVKVKAFFDEVSESYFAKKDATTIHSINLSEEATKNKERIVNLYNSINTTSVQLSKDDIVSELLEKSKMFFDYLQAKQNEIQLVPIISNEIEIYTLIDSPVYGIIWNRWYWDFFSAFANVVVNNIKTNRDQTHINYELFGADVSIHNLLRHTFNYLRIMLSKDDSNDIDTLKVVEDRIYSILKLKHYDLELPYIANNSISYFIYFGKLFVLFHEIEHVLNREENRPISLSFGFDNLLKMYKSDISRRKGRTHNNISQQERIDCIDKILKKEGYWAPIYKELGTDINAFCNSVDFIRTTREKPYEYMVLGCVCGSKLIAMFRTYLNIMLSYSNKVFELKRGGYSSIEDVGKALEPYIKQVQNEIEFRDVLNAELQDKMLSIFLMSNWVSQKEYDKILIVRKEIIDSYQEFFPVFFETFQVVMVEELFS